MGRKRRGDGNPTGQLTLASNAMEVYGQIVEPLGQGRFKVNCSDGITRIAKVRGKHYKCVWIRPNDIVLLCLREGAAGMADIVLRYMPGEVTILRDNNYIGDSFGNDNEGNLRIDFDQI